MILPDSSPVITSPTPDTSMAIAAKVAAKRCAAMLCSRLELVAATAVADSSPSASVAGRFSFIRCQPDTAATRAAAVNHDAISTCGSAHNNTGLVSTAPKSCISARSVAGL